MLEEESRSEDAIIFTVYDSLQDWEDFREEFFSTGPEEVHSLQINFHTESRYGLFDLEVFENLCECISFLGKLRNLSLNDLRLDDNHLDIFSRMVLESGLALRRLQLGEEDKFNVFNFSDFSLSNRFTMKAISNLLHSIAVHSPNLESLNEAIQISGRVCCWISSRNS